MPFAFVATVRNGSRESTSPNCAVDYSSQDASRHLLGEAPPRRGGRRGRVGVRPGRTGQSQYPRLWWEQVVAGPPGATRNAESRDWQRHRLRCSSDALTCGVRHATGQANAFEIQMTASAPCCQGSLKNSDDLDSAVKEVPTAPQSPEMAPKTKKGLKGSIDDVLSDLLGDDMTLPEKPVEPASRAKDATGSGCLMLIQDFACTVSLCLQLLKRPGRVGGDLAESFLGDDFFDTLGGPAGADAEDSDISEADPQALVQAIQDLDDMDADLLGLKKSHPSSDKRAAKGSGKELPSNLQPGRKLTASEKGDASLTKKPPSPRHQYRKFSFEDVEDPLAGLLSEDEEGIAKKPPVTESKTTSDKSPSIRDPGPSIPLTPGDTPIRKKEELFDDGDDIMATLGFGDSPRAERKQIGDQEVPRPARSKLEELLGRGTDSKLLAHPSTGEHSKFKLDKKYQRPHDKEDSWDDDEILTFGAYQPTVGSSEGRQSRRQSVRFLAEGSPDPKGELGSRQSPPATSSPIQPRKGGADWLGLKDEDLDLLPASAAKEAQGDPALSTTTVPPPISQHSAPTRLPASSGAKLPAGSTGPPAEASQPSKLEVSREEEEDWLSHVLSRKKSQGTAREERPEAFKSLNSVGTAGRPPSGRSPKGWNQPALALSAEPTICFPSSQEPTGLSVPVQSLLTESPVPGLLPGSGYQKPFLEAQVQLQSGTAPLQAELLQCQARVAELEAQVRKLELERAQHRLLLESLQQRHQADLELIESAHRSRVKVLEASYQQREARLQRENEELSTQYLARCQEAEQAHAELTAQHQRRLAAAAQEKDQEMDRLRELQRASILEMRKDHEDQLQRLKLLKDREIDAVTSATSHTRSLNGVIEQMEKFSSSLTELASRVEASHLTTSQERELGIRQRDEQLRVLQEQLGRQQRDMEEERGRLQQVIGKMEARLNEQSRLLEQERWRVSAEQSKAEAMQRALEEQRKIMAQQMAMEREELERAKSALLEEQKSIMHKCGEERQRLAVEWAEFSTQQKLSKDRAQREAERALQVDTQREGTIISLAKEQAELKIRASELRAKEEQLAAEREAMERERQELRLEKEKVKATALRLQLRAEEVEHMSQVASKKYEEGEQALSTARQVRSEQQARLQVVQRQQEQLRQQEQHVHQEHLSLAQQRLQLDRVRQGVPSYLPELSPRAQGPATPSLCAFSAVMAPAAANPQHSQPAGGPGPAHLLAKLVLLRHTAEQDRDFLENEQFFLEALKKAPYNMTSHSA
ncbi:fas-binding factor 1 [Ctenodactylus gundi]